MRDGPILVVDGDVEICRFLQLALATEGYDVHTVDDTERGLAAAARTPPSLILLDHKSGITDAPAFARAYRALPGPHAPILVLSASGNIRTAAREAGAAGHLSKPFDLDDLFHLVESHLRRGPPPAGAGRSRTDQATGEERRGGSA